MLFPSIPTPSNSLSVTVKIGMIDAWYDMHTSPAICYLMYIQLKHSKATSVITGSKVKKIPYPSKNPFTWIFWVVSCPNYTYEVKDVGMPCEVLCVHVSVQLTTGC